MADMKRYAEQLDLSGIDGVFSAAQALYWHCADNHEGQNSERYHILSQLGYTPGAMEHGPGDGVERCIYDDLESGELEPGDLFAWIEAEIAAHKDE